MNHALEEIKVAICAVDAFHYTPLLGWKGKKKQGTQLGGCSTIFIGFLILAILTDQIISVQKLEGYYHRSIETVSNFTDIGIVQMKDMGTLPYFSVHYKGHRLNRKDDKHCSETGGNCFKLAKKYLEFKWNNAYENGPEWKPHHYESRLCGPDDIT